MRKSQQPLSITHPELAAQWHPTLNHDVTPKHVIAGSNKRFWWKCPEGPDHEWVTSCVHRTRENTGCPFCANHRVSVTNSLAALFPKIAAQWHRKKNGSKTSDRVVAGSNAKHWWKCKKGPDHEWEAKVVGRTGTNNSGCPYCANQKVSVTNSLATQSSDVAAQWHPTRNKGVTPDQVVAGSNRKYWWQCPEGPDHEWMASPDARTGAKRTGCPFSANLKVSVTNSLATQHSDIAAQWHPTRNGEVVPEHVVAGSGHRYWWKCPEGPDHEWKAALAGRTGEAKSGCPCCSGHMVSMTNCLATKFPEIAAQWHPTRNGELKPDQVTYGSERMVWWKCPNVPDHEWVTKPNSRTGDNATGCPYCSLTSRSKQEIYIAFELKTLFDFDVNKHKLKIGRRVRDIDILIPDLNLAIEFDGSYWHKDKQEKDATKTAALNRAGWRVIRIRKRPLKKIASNDIVVANNITPESVKPVVDQLLPHIEKVCGVQLPGIKRYLRRKTLVNKKAACRCAHRGTATAETNHFRLACL